jgi:hypothetical protein
MWIFGTSELESEKTPKQFISKEDKIELTRRYFKEFLSTN